MVTTYHTDSGSTVELTDFMPLSRRGRREGFPEIHRRVVCTQGAMDLVVRFEPQLDFATAKMRLLPRRHGVLVTDDDDEVVTLSGPHDLWWKFAPDGAALIRLRLSAGEQAWYVMRYDDDEVYAVDSYESERKLEETTTFWNSWVAKIQYQGPHRAIVERSALALKLLCYEPTGAIVAAPTTSLPEGFGGIRNWDYRYAWLRDSAFVLHAFHVLGQTEEADHFMRFLRKVTRKTTDAHLQIMYGVDGDRHLAERVLEHLEGYRGSAPVRVGNGAFDQLQLDVYGEVLETAYLWSRHHTIGEGTWTTLQRLVDWVAEHWRLPDNGIWEVRAGRQHYVMSKVMCWVALDRGIRLAEEFGLPASLDRWVEERDALRADIMERGWSEAKQSFVQYYGTEALDAANLIIPMVGFLPPDHPRVVGTITGVMRELTSDDQELVYRYRNEDGLEGHEGVFSICTFWLAHALILAGNIEHAERIFQRMLKHSNHVGLFSEQLAPTSGEFLGNFPQAFTHIALINCAHALEVWRQRAAASSADMEPKPEHHRR